jgi:amino acid adenylation domain-containing protein/non-ribosomal peptide synthase protein (TIGR01720 family)
MNTMSFKNIEDAYPLSPMQQGILFHSLYAPTSGVYVQQVSFELHGQLNAIAFFQAWEWVISRHPALRTAFVWDNLEKPLQVVGRKIIVPWVEDSWETIPPEKQQEKLQTLLQSDRQQGFELTRAPLMRFTSIKLSQASYYFIWSHHHLLLDGWSVSIVFKEVIAAYKALSQGGNLSLAQPHPYRDYIAWLQQQNLSAAQAFWQEQLRSMQAPTSISLGVSKLPDQAESYNQQQIQLSITTTNALKSFAQQHSLTLNTLVQGAWALLLSRYSGEQDVIFGTTVSGRPFDLAGVDSMVGLFINTLPTRVKVSFDELLLPWLQQLQNQQVEARQYEYSPLLEIQKWSEVAKDQPLFESIVVFENYPIEAISSLESDLNLEISVVDHFERTNYPLTLAVMPGQELSLKIAYDEGERFDRVSISRILGHLETLLKAMITNPQQCLKELSLLTAAEKHQLLVEWNNTKIEYPQGQCVHQLFEAQVEKTPLAVAVVLKDQQLTYRELNQRANQLAHYLQKLGVEPEKLVGICVERSLEMIVGLLAILKAGGAYVPLDPNYPTERLAFMVQDAQTPILLSQTGLLAQLPQPKAKVICLDDDWEIINHESKENLCSQVLPKNASYILYTSGSTGKPKAVVVEHRNTVAFLYWVAKVFSKEQLAGVLASTSICFDLSVFELFGTLSWGGKVILAENALSLPNLLAANEVTLINTVPSVIAELLRIKAVPASVGTINLAGEALQNSLVQQIYQHSTIQQIYNLYGPSEGTTYSTFALINRGDVVTIGRPITNTQCFLLDTQMQPVSIGVCGEIYIGGAGIAREYLNRPELTAEKFISNPFSNIEGDRLYKTGDLGRYLPDGNIEYLGRIDDQVKVRGFRIELGEIEAVLNQHPAVFASVVVVREDVVEKKNLTAYIIYLEQTVSIAELRRFLQSKLPNYMMPTAFVILETLPLTPNGKLDRQALPAPDRIQLISESNFVPPSTPVEEILARTWVEVLGIDKVGVDDNFFELGGDSIIAIQVIAKANQAGLNLTPRQLFQHQTIAELAADTYMTQTIQVKQDLVAEEVHLRPIEDWFLAQKRSNQSLLLEMRQICNPNLLEQVVRHLIEYHDALRLGFMQQESSWQHQATTNEMMVFRQVDLSRLPEQAQKLAIESAIAEQTNLDLSQEALVKVVFFDLGSQKTSYLLITVCSLVVDDVSWRILIEDLQTAYQQICQGKAIHLPDKTTSFQTWLQYLQAYLQSSEIIQEREYWLAEMQKPLRSLPRDYFGNENMVIDADIVSVYLDKKETQALLKEVHKAYTTQINDVLLTALVQAFAKWTGEPTLWVDIKSNAREKFKDVNLSRTVGGFTTCYPLHLDITEATYPENALIAVKEKLRQVSNQGISYSLLHYSSSNQEIESKCQPSVRFSYFGLFEQMISESSLFYLDREVNNLSHTQDTSRIYLLDVNAIVVKEQFQFNWTYSKGIHRRETIQTLADNFIAALQVLIAHCQSLEAQRYTPSDFPKANLNQQKLDKFLAKMNRASENKSK